MAKTAPMKKKTVIVVTAAAAVAGFSLYLAFKSRERKNRRKKNEDVANSFTYAKRYDGGEFVL
jgi:hypothetical protein